MSTNLETKKYPFRTHRGQNDTAAKSYQNYFGRSHRCSDRRKSNPWSVIRRSLYMMVSHILNDVLARHRLRAHKRSRPPFFTKIFPLPMSDYVSNPTTEFIGASPIFPSSVFVPSFPS